METREAARVSAEAAAILARAISKTTDPNALSLLAQGLSPVAVWLKPQEGAEVATTLTWAIGKAYTSGSHPLKSEDPFGMGNSPLPTLDGLTQGLAAVLNGGGGPDQSAEASGPLTATGRTRPAANLSPYVPVWRDGDRQRRERMAC